MDVEENKYFGLCKCCLRDGCFRILWGEYNDNGVLQNYGEMLNECFSLHWQKPNNLHLEQICDDCAERTVDAYSFRQLVLTSQEQLGSSSGAPNEQAEFLDTCTRDIPLIVKVESCSNPSDYEELGEYEEVEYLEEDMDKKQLIDGALEVEIDMEELIDDPKHSPEPPAKLKRKWKPKKKKSERKRTYKNYTNEDLKQSVDAAKSGQMTVAEASVHYNVPRKTIASKVLSVKRGEPVEVKTDKNHDMVKEVRTLLTYTNATPYKTRTAHYHCAYCSTDGPLFEDPDELRTHTRTQHAGERTKSVERILRPLWLNEVLKVDIENLHCTVCCIILVSWNDMFQHLKDHHNLDFDEAYTRVIPYILKNDLYCALCKEGFPNYHHLDAHMNAHYNNYMCSECGDTFLSSSRLKKHLKIHETGRFACDECGKVFTLEKYRKKHIELVHKQESNIRCLYCPEKFLGTYKRHLHVIECHNEKVKTITCELCGKTFDWKPYYLAHVRRKHENEKNYKCSFCSAQFFMKSELRRHEASHKKKGSGSKFACTICGKGCYTKSALSNHYNSHVNRNK